MAVKEFPLEPGKYFSVPDDTGNGIARGAWVVQICRAIGARPRSVFEDEVDKLVRVWQDEHGLPITGQVTQADWAVMFPEDVEAR